MRRHPIRSFLRHAHGSAAIEFAAVAPMLGLILLPMVDIGMGTWQKMRVQDAAEAGAQYALVHGYSSINITSAAQSATSLGSGVTVTLSEACYCVTGGAMVATTTPASPPPCSGTCSDGSTPGTYVSVTTSSSYSMMFSYPGLTNPMTLGGYAVVRIS